MDARDRDQYSRLDQVDRLIVQLQREMLAGGQRQAQELEQLRQSIEMQRMQPPETTAATKAKAIGVILSSIIVGLVTAALQNGWFDPPKKADPKNAPIPVSTYQ